MVQRARIVLLAAAGHGTEEIAGIVGWTARAVRKWKARFTATPSLSTLKDAGRSGRPSKVPLSIRCQLVSLACERPNHEIMRFRDVWTYASLSGVLAAKTGYRLSTSEIGRILRFKEIRPHHIKQWLHSPDPNFLPKAQAVCDLYLHPPKDAVVVCVDEKPMQALERRHPTHVCAEDGTVRYEYEYKRHGTQVLLAAFDIASGKVLGRVLPRRTAPALVGFMEELARRYPTQHVYVVWDNLNVHYDGKEDRWTEFNARHGGRFHFVYTPKHASWMNQVEIWFSILHRRVIRHGDFGSASHQKDEVEGFIKHWNKHERTRFAGPGAPTTSRITSGRPRLRSPPMPKHQAEDYDPQTVERLLHARQFAHLRARKYGAAVIVESGPNDDPVKHFRLTRNTVHLWLLDITDHRGRWERTPARASLQELVTLVMDSFPWTLQPIHDYPERTSDPEH